MSVISDALARLIDEIPAVVRPVVDDEGFGSDLYCDDDLTPDMRELRSDDPLIVAQAIYRRLITPRGALIDDPDYGVDVRSFLHKAMTPSEQRATAGQIRLEILKDDRVMDVDVQLANVQMRSFDLEIRCSTEVGPFELVGSVSDAGFAVKILRGGE